MRDMSFHDPQAKIIKNLANKLAENINKEKVKSVDHPEHYGGKDNPYEVIKIIEHYKLGFNLGNTTKYILRAGKKDPNKHIEDLEKSVWYIQREIDNLKKIKND